MYQWTKIKHLVLNFLWEVPYLPVKFWPNPKMASKEFSEKFLIWPSNGKVPYLTSQNWRCPLLGVVLYFWSLFCFRWITSHTSTDLLLIPLKPPTIPFHLPARPRSTDWLVLEISTSECTFSKPIKRNETIETTVVVAAVDGTKLKFEFEVWKIEPLSNCAISNSLSFKQPYSKPWTSVFS